MEETKLNIKQDGRIVFIWDMVIEFNDEFEAKRFINEFIIKRIADNW